MGKKSIYRFLYTHKHHNVINTYFDKSDTHEIFMYIYIIVLVIFHNLFLNTIYFFNF